MDFRSLVFITLWTLLVGPVFDMPMGSPKAQQSRTVPSPVQGR